MKHMLSLFLRFFLFLYIQRIENRTSLDLVMVSGSACVVDFVIKYIGISNCVDY